MSTASFAVLLKDVQNQWQAGSKQTMIANAFANLNNSFSSAQVTQLLQQIDAEDTRLILAKASYRSITDPINFNNVFALFNNQASKNELSAYINNYSNNNPAAHVAMNNTSFSGLLQTLLNEWPESSRLTRIVNALNTNDYFTSSQARQLIQTVNAESSRLQLAKTAYKHITDVANYNTVAELLYSEASRNDLSNYIRNGGELTNSVPVQTSMTDAAFENILNNVRSQWLPGSKMVAIQQVLAQTDNYFSTVQIRQLVVFVTTEANRLQLLKSAFKNATDKSNYSNLYDLLSMQASKDELIQYIKA
jgi:acylphosphatase